MIGINLYEYDSMGRGRFWRAEQDGNKYRFVSGLIGGKAVTSTWTVVTEGKNLGKINETTPESQATSILESHYRKRQEQGYSLTLDTSGTTYFEPMLAHGWDKFKPKTFPCYSQPKLDGIRCIAQSNGLWTRNGKKIVSCIHIEKALEPFFELYPDETLDGELYNHTLHDDFNKITSLVRREKDISIFEQMEIEQMVEYHIYDWPSSEKFNVRNSNLDYFRVYIDSKLKLVDTKFVVDQNQLDLLFAQYLSDGYEGQMIRYDLPYENKRSKSLLKRKEFQDAEFTILELEEGKGNWSGYIKTMRIRLPDGQECRSSLRGNQDFLRNLLETKDDYIDGTATVRYFNLTPDGIPRFPVAVAVYKKGEQRS